MPSIRRRLIQNETFDKFVYAVENTRLHDVVLTIEIEGENAKMLPAGAAAGTDFKAVEGVVGAGQLLVFATVEPLVESKRFAFAAQMKVDRIDVEVRVTELQGVFLYTRIVHGKISELSFEASTCFFFSPFPTAPRSDRRIFRPDFQQEKRS